MVELVQKQRDYKARSIADHLMREFPQLDIRFSHELGTNTLLCAVRSQEDFSFSIPVDVDDLEYSVQQAILNVKALGRMFDD